MFERLLWRNAEEARADGKAARHSLRHPWMQSIKKRPLVGEILFYCF